MGYPHLCCNKWMWVTITSKPQNGIHKEVIIYPLLFISLNSEHDCSDSKNVPLCDLKYKSHRQELLEGKGNFITIKVVMVWLVKSSAQLSTAAVAAERYIISVNNKSVSAGQSRYRAWWFLCWWSPLPVWVTNRKSPFGRGSLRSYEVNQRSVTELTLSSSQHLLLLSHWGI